MSGAILVRLPHTTAPGSVQMGMDRALLRWAAAGPSRVAFRTYEWSGPTLSLGRAEPFPGEWDPEAIAGSGIAVVRRPTGGDGVLHVDEVTFAIAAALPGPWGLGPRAFADRIAEALASSLRDLGLPAEVARPTEPGGGPWDRREPCFARTARGEIRARGYKVAGIASRFTRGAALSHASVPLSPTSRDVGRLRRDPDRSREALDLHARSIPELLEVGADPCLVRERIAHDLPRAVASSLGVELTDSSFESIGVDPADASLEALGVP